MNIFLKNKYTTWYTELIDKARSRQKLVDQYVEVHHIIPKSLGGTDSNDNLVTLTAKEHFIAHLLLTKATNTWQMTCAIHKMLHSDHSGKRYVSTNSRTYEYVRKQHSLVVSAYSKNTVTCQDLQTGLWARIPQEQFKQNKERYRAANTGKPRLESSIDKQEDTKFPFVVTILGQQHTNARTIISQYPRLVCSKLVKLFFNELPMSNEKKYYTKSQFEAIAPFENKLPNETCLEYVKRSIQIELKLGWHLEDARNILNRTTSKSEEASISSRRARTKYIYYTPKGTFLATCELQQEYPFMTADMIRSIINSNTVNRSQLRIVPFLTKEHNGRSWTSLGFNFIKK
jgi:hypothetical protein